MLQNLRRNDVESSKRNSRATAQWAAFLRANQNGHTFGQVDSYCGPMGAVIGVTRATVSATGSPVSERFDADALGKRTYTRQQNIKPSTHPDQNGERNYTLDSYRRLSNVLAPTGFGYWYNKNLEYDNSGNLATTTLDEQDYNTGTSLKDASISYCDAADRLVVFNRAIGPYANDESHPGQRNVFEEYRYDALGRRVAVRSRRTSSCSTTYIECHSYIERTVWDGDQVIYEIRAPGGTSASTSTMEADNGVYSGQQGGAHGQTAYVHAGEIDQPIVVMRKGYNGSSSPITVHPHQNWRGVFELGTKSDGTLMSYTTGSPQIAWPGAKGTVDGEVGNKEDGPIWFGGLIPGKADGSGMQYMRNRYYDPATGRFTQQDPIGLAGGMNLYGFAGGNPITYSDPFGLDSLPKGTYVGCRQVNSSNVQQASSSGGILVGNHCAIRSVSGKDDLIGELQKVDKKNDIAWRAAGEDAALYDWKRVYGVTTDDVRNSFTDWANTLNGASYSPDGSRNSNRFVFSVITGAKGKVPRSAVPLFGATPGICGGTGIMNGNQCK